MLYGAVASHAWNDEPRWGIYARDGRLVDAAAYYRGPGKLTVGQTMWVDRAAIPAGDAPDETYIYGGIFIQHFGHFLLSSLGRFWPFVDNALRARLGPYRILCHGMSGPDHWWTFPYKAEPLQALGIPKERLAWFAEPTRVRRLIVPRPAFEEHNFVHDAYVRLTREVGTRLLRGGGPVVPAGPAYLSRTDYPQISQGFDEEATLSAAVAGLGVQVVFPEALSLADQIRMVTGRPVVAGFIGSAFHAAAFSPDPARLLMLSPTHVIGANFGLLDRAAGLRAQYFHVGGKLLDVSNTARIINRFRMGDPDGAARDLLGLIQAACTAEANPGRPGGVAAAHMQGCTP